LAGFWAAFGCATEPNYRTVESSPQDWVLPGPKTDTKVFGPMPYEDVRDFVARREAEGWMTVQTQPAQHPLDGQYLITMRRWAH